MKNVKSIVNNSSRVNLQRSFIDACSDPDFKKYVYSLGISEDILMKYTSLLNECVCQRKNCKLCKGIFECRNKISNYVLTPEMNQKRIIFSYVACSKYQDYLESTSYDKNIICYDVNKKLKRASFKDIYKDDAERIPVIKYITSFKEKYLKGESPKGLYLSGSFGSGKTYLISALFNELAKKNVKSVIIYYPEFLRDLKSSFNDSYEEKFNSVKKAKLLLIDDIGAEGCSSWNRDEILGSILQYRMESNLPTFFTSNLNLLQLEEHLSNTNSGVEKIKARRILERVKQLTEPIQLVSQNRRNNYEIDK